MGLFTPKWMNKNEATALAAETEIYGKRAGKGAPETLRLLEKIGGEALSPAVREKALADAVTVRAEYEAALLEQLDRAFAAGEREQATEVRTLLRDQADIYGELAARARKRAAAVEAITHIQQIAPTARVRHEAEGCLALLQLEKAIDFDVPYHLSHGRSTKRLSQQQGDVYALNDALRYKREVLDGVPEFTHFGPAKSLELYKPPLDAILEPITEPEILFAIARRTKIAYVCHQLLRREAFTPEQLGALLDGWTSPRLRESIACRLPAESPAWERLAADAQNGTDLFDGYVLLDAAQKQENRDYLLAGLQKYAAYMDRQMPDNLERYAELTKRLIPDKAYGALGAVFRSARKETLVAFIRMLELVQPRLWMEFADDAVIEKLCAVMKQAGGMEYQYLKALYQRREGGEGAFLALLAAKEPETSHRDNGCDRHHDEHVDEYTHYNWDGSEKYTC